MVAVLASSAFLIFVGLIPSFAWLAFYSHEDAKHPEPKRVIFFAFLAGAGVTFLVLPIQIFLNNQFSGLGIESYTFWSFLILGGVEEIFKFLAVFVFIHRLKAFDEPIHAMIYMITAALGFAAVENVASLFQAADGSIFNIAVLESLSLRFVGATLLHTLASGFIGYYWARAFIKDSKSFILRHDKEWAFILEGLLIATVLHAIFNYLIITSGPATLAIAFLVIVAFFLLSDFEKFKREDLA